MALVKVTRKYQITLPKDVRPDIHIGDKVEILRVGDDIMIRRKQQESGEGDLWGLGENLWKEVDAVQYIRELRSEWDSRELGRWRAQHTP